METVWELFSSRTPLIALQVATVGTLVMLLLRGKIKLPRKAFRRSTGPKEAPRPLGHVQAEYTRQNDIQGSAEGGSPAETVIAPQGEMLCPKELTERIDRIAARVKSRSAGNRA